MRSAETLLDVFACAETRIDEILLFQDFQGITVGVLSTALAERFAIPIDAKPTEIFFDLLIVFLADT
jgi:hypothetical protein